MDASNKLTENEDAIAPATATDLVLKCIKDHKADAETQRCISGLLKAEEEKMNEMLATVQSQGAVDFKTVSAAQEAWEIYVSKHCEVREANSFDSIRKSCLVEETRDRSNEIAGLVID